MIVDKNHIHFELLDSGVIIRKRAAQVNPGNLVVLPSNLDGDSVPVKATEKISEKYFSLNHGTGRVMSRSEAKTFSENYDYHELR